MMGDGTLMIEGAKRKPAAECLTIVELDYFIYLGKKYLAAIMAMTMASAVPQCLRQRLRSNPFNLRTEGKYL